MRDHDLELRLVHGYADARTRARMRRSVRDLPVFGLERPSFRAVCSAFREWKATKRRRRPRINTWMASSRALRTDDTPILCL